MSSIMDEMTVAQLSAIVADLAKTKRDIEITLSSLLDIKNDVNQSLKSMAHYMMYISKDN